MSSAYDLLIVATEKLIKLKDHPDWCGELPTMCPPIVWFGNSLSSLPKVVTIGANPSRWEYLNRKDCSLLIPPRFYHLVHGEDLEDVFDNEELRNRIIAGYDQYFLKNPYKKWFGKAGGNSYNVQGFLSVLGASYYEEAGCKYQAIHIDLFPFATMTDYNRLRSVVSRDLFETDWSQRFIRRLFSWLNPQLLIIFGRGNTAAFKKYFDQTLELDYITYDHALCSAGYSLEQGVLLDAPTLSLTTNLGNPKGFTSKSLKEYGRFIQNELLTKNQQG